MTNAEPAPLKLTDEIKEIVGGAFEKRIAHVVVYVDEGGQPSMSMRGTVQVWSDTQLALWARGGSNLPQSLADRPRMTLFYFDPATRTMLQYRGRARVDTSADVRDRVFDNSPEPEQRADPDRLGNAVIIDLDRINGRTPAGVIVQVQEA